MNRPPIYDVHAEESSHCQLRKSDSKWSANVFQPMKCLVSSQCSNMATGNPLEMDVSMGKVSYK